GQPVLMDGRSRTAGRRAATQLIHILVRNGLFSKADGQQIRIVLGIRIRQQAILRQVLVGSKQIPVPNSRLLESEEPAIGNDQAALRRLVVHFPLIAGPALVEPDDFRYVNRLGKNGKQEPVYGGQSAQYNEQDHRTPADGFSSSR